MLGKEGKHTFEKKMSTKHLNYLYYYLPLDRGIVFTFCMAH